MQTTTKTLVNTVEVWAMLPGRGQAILTRLLAAQWITPCSPARKPYYRTADVLACIERLSAGEVPRPIHRWRACLGESGIQLVTHLIPAGGRAAVCGKRGDWMTAAEGTTSHCARCKGAAKTLAVEEP